VIMGAYACDRIPLSARQAPLTTASERPLTLREYRCLRQVSKMTGHPGSCETRRCLRCDARRVCGGQGTDTCPTRSPIACIQRVHLSRIMPSLSNMSSQVLNGIHQCWKTRRCTVVGRDGTICPEKEDARFVQMLPGGLSGYHRRELAISDATRACSKTRHPRGRIMDVDGRPIDADGGNLAPPRRDRKWPRRFLKEL